MSHNIKYLNTSQFKTISLVLKFKAPLDESTMTLRSVLSKMIQKTSQKYPTEIEMMNHLSELYGANLYSSVLKQNNAHVVTLGIDIINDKYLADTNLLEEAFKLLHEVLYFPNVQNEAFNTRLVHQEKRLLRNKFLAIKENIGQYGFYQLLKTMFQDDPNRLPSFGDEYQLDHIDGTVLYQAFQKMKQEDEIYFYAVGEVDSQEIEDLYNKYILLESTPVILSDSKLERNEEMNYVEEAIDTTQARLNIGMKFDVQHPERSYFSFIVLNHLFGGDASSMLFMNVREKLSLAYQIHSQIDARNGLLYVLAGVNQQNKAQAIETIQHQFEMIKSGEIDDKIVDLSKRLIINSRLESLDRPKDFVETSFSNTFGTEISQEQWIEGIQAVTKDDIVNLAKTGYFHTIYCLVSEVL
ncbi:insulinase family protein [Macrococcoides canis]|uniref:Insulinase family protein n=1 Tax=Macrococcoides canis TaxID=1855823 RepID=A0A4R6C6J1_9STAP|nr:pitrilysin family protein [Macrococcus canis]TDM18044.1 insulinase family protein [Macrococcus canis]TDM21883.1 insulinase family protein [Macrococcus canis]TDM32646.1 insulinase family protein [Macrococcus canis]TDM38005.1 insulinase family protein [Macrococcus canis]